MPISIEFDFNWYYDPDEFIPPGNCVNSFDNIAELVQYIDDEMVMLIIKEMNMKTVMWAPKAKYSIELL